MTQIKRPKRHYSDNEKANALITLELNKFDYQLTSRSTGIPRKTIEEWQNGRVNQDVHIIRQHRKENLADRFESLAHLYIDQATNTFEHSKGTQAIVGAATATDKMRLLRGESTIISEQANDKVATALRKFLEHKREQSKLNGTQFPTDHELLAMIETACKANNADVESVKRQLQIDSNQGQS